MKLKNNSSISIKPLTTVFFFSSLIAIVLRCLQMAKYIDPETGFITGGEIFNVILYAVLFIPCLYFIISSFLSRQAGEFDIHGIKSPVLGSVTAVFAISLVYDWISSFVSGIASLADTSYSGGIQSLMSSGSLPLALQSVFAFFSAIYFFIVAADFFKGKNTASKFKILALTPVCWTGFRLIHRFIRQISFVEVSDLFLELVMLALMIIFFMSFAQVNSGVYSEGFTWRLIGFGLSGAVIAITLSIARLIFTFVGNRAYIVSEHPFNFADFAFAVCFAVLVSEVSKCSAAVKEDRTTAKEITSENEGG